MIEKDNKRRHVRLSHSAEISLQIAANEAVIVHMRDFSDSGLYLISSEDKVKIGDIVKVKTLEFEDAPTQQAIVVRIEPGKGFAVEFLV